MAPTNAESGDQPTSQFIQVKNVSTNPKGSWNTAVSNPREHPQEEPRNQINARYLLFPLYIQYRVSIIFYPFSFFISSNCFPSIWIQ